MSQDQDVQAQKPAQAQKSKRVRRVKTPTVYVPHPADIPRKLELPSAWHTDLLNTLREMDQPFTGSCGVRIDDLLSRQRIRYNADAAAAEASGDPARVAAAASYRENVAGGHLEPMLLGCLADLEADGLVETGTSRGRPGYVWTKPLEYWTNEKHFLSWLGIAPL